MKTVLVIIICTFTILSSCDLASSLDNSFSYYKGQIVNESDKILIIDYATETSTDIIMLTPQNKNERAYEYQIYNEHHNKSVIPALTKEEFSEKISRLLIYYFDKGDTIQLGTGNDYFRNIDLWEYTYTLEWFGDVHAYKLVIK